MQSSLAEVEEEDEKKNDTECELFSVKIPSDMLTETWMDLSQRTSFTFFCMIRWHDVPISGKGGRDCLRHLNLKGNFARDQVLCL